jgi:hypothetical protein
MGISEKFAHLLSPGFITPNSLHIMPSLIQYLDSSNFPTREGKVRISNGGPSQMGNFKVLSIFFSSSAKFSVCKFQGIMYTHPDKKFQQI